MAPNESFLNVTQDLFAPDMVQKMSEETGETFEKTREALKSVVPTFTSEILEQGATIEGATSLLEMVNKENENPLINKSLSAIGEQVGLSRAALSKMLFRIAPSFMKIIKSKVENEKLSAAGLMTFLQQQKLMVAGVSPETSEFYKLSGADPSVDLGKSPSTAVPWKAIAIVTVVLIAMWFWWNSLQIKSAFEP